MINATDSRHGSRAGYLAGCRQACCTEPNYRYQKRSKLRLQREGTQIASGAPVVKRAHWWLERGVSLNGISEAAGLGYGTLAELVAGERDVCLKSTARAILSITWDTLPDRAMCAADLTKLRIYSMMAAGHPLSWIHDQTGEGLPISGRWRTQTRVTLATARAVQSVYDAAPLEGPSKVTAVKARNKGYQHPLGWDDPGVPAMPFGWTPSTAGTLDQQARRLAARGHWRPDELAAEWSHLRSLGVSIDEAAARLGITVGAIEKAVERSGQAVAA